MSEHRTDRSIKDLPIELEPLYVTREVNEPIVLHEGDLKLVVGNKQMCGTGSISFEWLPTPRLSFEVSHTGKWDKLRVGPCQLIASARE